LHVDQTRWLAHADSTLWGVGLFCVVGLAIAIGTARLGVWPVLLFLSLELVVFAVAFYVLQRRTRFYDLLVSMGHQLKSTQRNSVSKKHRRLRCYWAQARLTGSHLWHPGWLGLGSYGQYIEKDAALTEDDRVETAGQLGWLLARSPLAT
tara:strand:+ start:2481 stop:2930 length:450 start_codon:yes stop_codon:yes gene_type:complete